LKLRHRAKTALDATIKELRDKNIDPLSVENGRFFSFRRTGMGLDTSFQVTVKKQKMIVEVGGEKMEVEKDLVHVLTPELIARLKDEAAELSKLFRSPSAEEIGRIVAESDLKTGTSPNIDAILGIGEKKDATAAQEEDYDDVPDEELAPAPQAAPAVKAETKPEPKAEKAAPAPQAAAPATKSAPKAEAEMDEDEFLASLGLNN